MQLIDADEFIKGLEDLYQRAGWDRREVHFSLADTIANMEMMPTVEAEPVRHGKWIYGEHEIAMCDGYRCNKCGYFVPWDYGHKSIDYIKEYHYCPNCGAKMDEREEE